MELIIISLRYILLIILYLFIFRVIFLVVRDIKGSNPKLPETENIIPVPDDESASHLIIVKSDVPALAEGTRIKLAEDNFIGRGPDNRIQILDNFTSQNHARLSFFKGQYLLEDLGSKNGTFVDGVRLDKPIALINGDLFQIGGVTFKFER